MYVCIFILLQVLEHVQNVQDCYIDIHVPWWFAASIDLSSKFPPLNPHPQHAPVCVVPWNVSMCSHHSAPTDKWEHVLFGFLFLCQFSENAGFQLHPWPYKGHELILLWLHSIQWCICATFSLSSLSLIGIWVDSMSLLLRIVLQWTYSCIYFCNRMIYIT